MATFRRRPVVSHHRQHHTAAIPPPEPEHHPLRADRRPAFLPNPAATKRKVHRVRNHTLAQPQLQAAPRVDALVAL